jgi:hypothetical protein
MLPCGSGPWWPLSSISLRGGLMCGHVGEAHGGTVGSTSLRSELPCSHVAPHLWSHLCSTFLGGGLSCCHMALRLWSHLGSTSSREGVLCCHVAPRPWLHLGFNSCGLLCYHVLVVTPWLQPSLKGGSLLSHGPRTTRTMALQYAFNIINAQPKPIAYAYPDTAST